MNHRIAVLLLTGATNVALAQVPSATLASRAPVIDGHDTDAVWRTASAISAFRIFDPVEDGEPKFRSEAKIAYDTTQPVRPRACIRRAARQHPRAALPPRRAHPVGPDQGDDRLLSRPADGLRVRREPGRREARLLRLRRQPRGRIVGRGVGRRDAHRLARMDRRSSASRCRSSATRAPPRTRSAS